MASLTIPQTLNRSIPTLWSIERAYGWDALLMIVTTILAQADVMMGGDGNAGKCEMWASQVITRPDVRGRGLSYLIVALRDGIARYTLHDKRFGLDQINKMLNDRDREIMGQLETPDEVGEAELRGMTERMNDAENNAQRDARKLRAEIAELKAKLSADKPNDHAV